MAEAALRCDVSKIGQRSKWHPANALRQVEALAKEDLRYTTVSSSIFGKIFGKPLVKTFFRCARGR